MRNSPPYTIVIWNIPHYTVVVMWNIPPYTLVVMWNIPPYTIVVMWTFLPIQSSCETFLPIPSSSCETFLPIPSSSCETFLPIPSSCETFLPIPSSCETSLPIPSSRQHFYYLSPYKLINTGILITSNVQVINLVSIVLAFIVRFCSQTSCPFVLRFPFFPLLVSCFGPRVSHWIILPYVNSRFRSVLYILFTIDFLFLDLTCTHCILLLCYTTLNCHVNVLDSLVAVSVLSFLHSYLLNFFFCFDNFYHFDKTLTAISLYYRVMYILHTLLYPVGLQ